MWRNSDVKINFKHIKIYFYVRFDVFYYEKCRDTIEKNDATQRFEAFLLRRCRKTLKSLDFVSRRNV